MTEHLMAPQNKLMPYCPTKIAFSVKPTGEPKRAGVFVVLQQRPLEPVLVVSEVSFLVRAQKPIVLVGFHVLTELGWKRLDALLNTKS